MDECQTRCDYLVEFTFETGKYFLFISSRTNHDDSAHVPILSASSELDDLLCDDEVARSLPNKYTTRLARVAIACNSTIQKVVTFDFPSLKTHDKLTIYHRFIRTKADLYCRGK